MDSDSENDVFALEKGQISMLIQSWGIWRDTGIWGKLRQAYTPDATMAVSWFDGSASDFVDRCAQLSDDQTRRISSQHLIGASAIEVRGDRGIAETRTSILIRLPVDQIEVDVTAIARFYDFFEKGNRAWRIRRRVAIFDKDSMQPVDPTESLKINQQLFRSFPEPYRCCAYVLAARGGMIINTNLPTAGSASLAALYAQGKAWLDRR
jgi:hypothetical protein